MKFYSALLYWVIVFNNLVELKKKKEILFISLDELKRRFKLMKKFFFVIPENIEYKINCLIKHIEKNEKNYYGIRTIYTV